MVNVCYACGSESYSEHLTYCQCKDLAVHRYCSDDSPASISEDVTWFCNKCEPKTAKSSGVTEPDSSLLKKHCSIIKGMEDGLFEKDENMNLITSMKESDKSKLSKTQRKRGLEMSENAEKDQDQESKNQKMVVPGEEPSFLEKDKLAVGHVQYPADASLKNNLITAQPVVDPAWKGRFSIRDEKYGTICGFAAHLSTLACPRVRDEAKLLPEFLCLDLLPSREVWPKSFENSRPTDHNIALYFFSDSERNKKVYGSLLNDMIVADLAMKAVTDNAELLVFTSTKLPVEHWRCRAKFYLWGVFRRKLAPNSAQDGATSAEGQEQADSPIAE